MRSQTFEKGKSIRQRYDELCINIAFYETKLQTALTTSQNFKEGLDAAIKALQDLKKQIDKLPEVARNLNELREEAQQFKVRNVFLILIRFSRLATAFATYAKAEFLTAMADAEKQIT